MENLENYKEEELTTTAVKANIYGTLFFIPFLILFGLSFFLIWHTSLSEESIKNDLHISWFVIIATIFIGIALHELIHGATWSLFAKQGFKSMKFGILWKSISPFCHCKEPLLVKHYMAGIISPGIILGFIPSIISLATGNITLLIFGMFFTYAAGGDFFIIYLLRNQKSNNLIKDHPSKIGCSVFTPV